MQGSGFRVQGSRFRVQGTCSVPQPPLSSIAPGLSVNPIVVNRGFHQGSRCRTQGSGFRVQGSGFRVQGSGCRVQGLSLVPQPPLSSIAQGLSVNPVVVNRGFTVKNVYAYLIVKSVYAYLIQIVTSV